MNDSRKGLGKWTLLVVILIVIVATLVAVTILEAVHYAAYQQGLIQRIIFAILDLLR